jgi:predicted dehydrogenase
LGTGSGRRRCTLSPVPAVARPIDSDGPCPSVAVIGCGRWGRHIARDLLQLGCRVIAVDVSDAARQAAVAQGAFAACPTLVDYDGYDRLDGVVVAGPTRLHAQLTSAALDLGVPVFVEKPMTDDLSSAEELVSKGADRLFVMHKWHYHPGIEALADLARSGDLGTVYGVTSSRVGSVHPSDTDMLWLLAPHEITIGACVLGGYPARVEAVAEIVGGELTGIDVAAHCDDGRWHHWTISTRPEAVSRQVVVVGSHGQALFPSPYSPHVDVRTIDTTDSGDGDGEARRLIAVDQEPPLLRELRCFRDHLLGGPPPPTSAADGLEVVRTIVAIRASAGLLAEN